MVDCSGWIFSLPHAEIELRKLATSGVKLGGDRPRMKPNQAHALHGLV